MSLSSTTLSLLAQSNSVLLEEIIQVSSDLQSFLSSSSQLQILSLQSQNSLFAFNPQLLQFSSGCNSNLNQLLQITQSPLNEILVQIEVSDLSDEVSGCLDQLLQLEVLASSGSDDLDLGSDENINNGSSLFNSSSSVSNSTIDSSSNITASAVDVNSTANATADVAAVGQKKGKGKGKKGTRDVMKRSGGDRLKVVTGLGLGLVFGAALLSL